MATGSNLEQLARAIKRSNTASPAWLPRTPQLSQHFLTVTGVDNGNGVVDVQFPDPSGLIVSGVRVIQPYGIGNSPQVGHVVLAHAYGTDMMVMGQLIVPTSVVIP